MKFEKTLKQLHELLIEDRRPKKQDYFSCKLLSSMFASLLLDELPKCYIIESSTHCVVFDGNDTWDLTYGCMFENYKYPDIDVPKFQLIPYFDIWWRDWAIELYYGESGIRDASKHIGIKEIKLLGVIDGTKKEKRRKAY